jgi:hypothetical protein
MPFFMPEDIIGYFEADGVLGLAPSLNGKSFIHHLHNQGQIEKMIVGLNFEDPANKQAVSSVTFGYWDENHIQGGLDSLDWYQNIGNQEWGVLLADLIYNGEELHTRGGMLALIDSANNSI